MDLSRVKEEIAKRKAKLVLVQLPEGLKQRTTEIMEELDVPVISLEFFGTFSFTIDSLFKNFLSKRSHLNE